MPLTILVEATTTKSILYMRQNGQSVGDIGLCMSVRNVMLFRNAILPSYPGLSCVGIERDSFVSWYHTAVLFRAKRNESFQNKHKVFLIQKWRDQICGFSLPDFEAVMIMKTIKNEWMKNIMNFHLKITLKKLWKTSNYFKNMFWSCETSIK